MVNDIQTTIFDYKISVFRINTPPLFTNITELTDKSVHNETVSIFLHSQVYT